MSRPDRALRNPLRPSVVDATSSMGSAILGESTQNNPTSAPIAPTWTSMRGTIHFSKSILARAISARTPYDVRVHFGAQELDFLAKVGAHLLDLFRQVGAHLLDCLLQAQLAFAHADLGGEVRHMRYRSSRLSKASAIRRAQARSSGAEVKASNRATLEVIGASCEQSECSAR